MGLQEKIEINDIYQIFNSIQESSASHLKWALTIKKALEENNGEELFRQFCRCLQYAFLTNFKERCDYIERMINFVALFATSFRSKDDALHLHPTLIKTFKFVLKLSNSADDSHRFWSCKLFNKMFQNLEELNDELYEKVKESMLIRLKDPKAAIRCQGIVALHRLQDPTDEEDPIICELCNTLESDFNAQVRVLCLEKLALNKHVMPFILERMRDVDPNVRLTAFQKLTTISAKYLKVIHKRLILQCGLNDSSEKIQNFVSTTLLESWLKYYGGNYLTLIKSVRLDACEEDIVATIHLVELILKALFKSASVEEIIKPITVNEQRLIEYENLNWESVLYYRFAVQYLRQCEDFEEHLNAVLPELVHFCRYIQGYREFMKNNENFDQLEYHFTLHQLFLITQGYDVSDTASQQCLNSLVHGMLLNEELTPDVAEATLRNLEKTIPDVNNRCVYVCEIISSIIYGDEMIDYEEVERKETERKHIISQLQSDIISLYEQEKHFVLVEKNYTEASRIKSEIEDKETDLIQLRNVRDKPEQVEKKTDVATMLKCLTIAEALLRSPTIKEFNPAIATLNTEVINLGVVHEDDTIKERALKCYGLCCVIDRRSARYGIHLFSGLIFSADLDNIEILVTSIKVVVDMLTIYGLSLVEKNDEEEASNSRREDEKKVFLGGTCLTDVIQALADHLEHEDLRVQKIATKGVCILLLGSRITSASLLSRIIIKWANPETEDEGLKQFIGLSLSSLTGLSNCYTYFGDAVLATIRTLAYAPKGSSLTDIDFDNLLKFMITLSQMPAQGDRIHSEIAFNICSQMRDKPRLKVNLYFAKALPLLMIPENKEACADLVTLCDDIKTVIRDSQILKHIDKFRTNLEKNNVKKLAPVEEDEAVS